jgi:serine/threonine protein kinase
MKPERWQQIERLYNSTLEYEPKDRAAFLDEACSGDETLRNEVEILLAYQSQAESFIELPALEIAAKVFAEDRTLPIDQSESLLGEQIGSYKIVSRLGAGGMGEVYLAEDTQLGRRVAIKLLPMKYAADERSRKLLMREARAAAKLDHPNICAIHEVGQYEGNSFIVMQYVEGETLAGRIERSPLNIREALDLAIQIAHALSEAHSHGIIHRDIKPQNVFGLKGR